MSESPSTTDSGGIHGILRTRFGFTSFRPGQERLIQGVTSGRDALGVLPTGGGKTLCFQIPAFALEGTVVVVSPLISLMKDQVGRATAVGLRARCITAMDRRSEQASALSEFTAGALDMLFVSPERLGTSGFRQRMADVRIALLAVDEAHCISEWGHDFRPPFREIARVRSLVSGPVLAVTATATPAVRDDITDVLALRDPIRVVTSFDRPNIFWAAQASVRGVDRVRDVVRTLRTQGDRGAAIVYAPTRSQVIALRRVLASVGLGAEAYHAGMTPDERKGVQERFLARDANLIVATNAFGMGIDRGDVDLVIHYGFPGSLESYYQEAGRAGRDGQPSRALAFVDRADWSVPRAFIDRSFPSVRRVHRVLGRLRRAGASIPAKALQRFSADWPSLRWLVRVGAVGANEELRDRIEGDGAAGGWSGREEARILAMETAPDLASLKAARSDALRRLKAARRYASTRGCRRKALLGYLGEVPEWSRCGGCDRCAGRGAPPAQSCFRRQYASISHPTSRRAQGVGPGVRS